MRYCQQRNLGRLTGWNVGPLRSPAEKSYKPSSGTQAGRGTLEWYSGSQKARKPGRVCGAMGVPGDVRGRDPSQPQPGDVTHPLRAAQSLVVERDASLQHASPRSSSGWRSPRRSRCVSLLRLGQRCAELGVVGCLLGPRQAHEAGQLPGARFLLSPAPAACTRGPDWPRR